MGFLRTVTALQQRTGVIGSANLRTCFSLRHHTPHGEIFRWGGSGEDRGGGGGITKRIPEREREMVTAVTGDSSSLMSLA